MKEFRTFHIEHFIPLAILFVILTLIFIFRKDLRKKSILIRRGMGIFFALQILSYQIILNTSGNKMELPLDLCDVSAIFSCIILFTGSQLLFELSYFWGIVGAGMALLTPNVKYQFPDVIYIEFFIGHSMIIISIFYMLVVEKMKINFKSVIKAFVYLNIYTAIIFIVDKIFGYNYMFLMEKPAKASLMDFLGPWPYYIFAEVILAFIFFIITYLVYRIVYKLKGEKNV